MKFLIQKVLANFKVQKTPKIIKNMKFYECIFSYSQFKDIENREFLYKVPNKDLICIFCLARSPLAEFDDKSHVIPYSLGNKFLMHREECKVCNDKFGRTIETELSSFTKIIRVMNRQENRNKKNPGYLKYVSKSQKALMQWNSELILEVTGERTQDILKECGEKNLLIDFEATYRDSDVYKALMKAIYGVIPPSYRDDFSKLRNWINTDDPNIKFLNKLIIHQTILPTIHPNNLILDVYRRKRDFKSFIFQKKYFNYYALIGFGNVLFDIPLMSDINIGNTKGLNFPLLSQLAVSEKGAIRTTLDMSKTEKVENKISFILSEGYKTPR